jgi:CheY-like chemotaxis protein
VVDDEPAICAVLKRLLEKRGDTVTTACTYEEAQAAFQATHFHMALVDFDLRDPLHTGIHVGHLAPRGCGLVMVSGYSPDEMRTRWEDPLRGFMTVIGKPLEERTLPDGKKRPILLDIVDKIEDSLEVTKPGVNHPRVIKP